MEFTASDVWFYTKRYIPAILAFVAINLVWQAYATIFKTPEYLLPKPTDIISLLLLPKLGWAANFEVTAYETVVGFAAAVPLGIAVAILMAMSRRFMTVAYPLVIAAQVAPKLAFIPILFIWMGFNIVPRIITVVLLCFFPIIIDTLTGLTSIEDDMVKLVRSFSKRRLDLLVRAMIPNALPSIFSGLKVSITIAVVGALVAEYVQSDKGLGHIILASQVTVNTSLAFASATMLVILGFILYIIIEILEKVFVPWKSYSLHK